MMHICNIVQLAPAGTHTAVGRDLTTYLQTSMYSTLKSRKEIETGPIRPIHLQKSALIMARDCRTCPSQPPLPLKRVYPDVEGG